MTNAKLTKRALVSSILSLVLCVSMFVGTTFAWFTDSVTSSNNIIQSGNLDIELEYAVFNADGTFKEWKDVKGASDILTNTLWEPGVTEVAYLRLANAGSLALKYRLGVNIVSETGGVNAAGNPFRLSDYIQFGVVEDVNAENAAYANRDDAVKALTEANKISAGYTKSSSMASLDELYFALVVYMPTTVGNEANHNGINVPQIDLGINVVATQMTAENDSFDNQYDANAPYQVYVDSEADLLTTLETATPGVEIVLNDDITVTAPIVIPAAQATFSMRSTPAPVVIDLNGNTINTAYVEGSTTNHAYAFTNNGNLLLKNGTVNARGIFNYGNMIIENATINAIDGNGGYAIRNYSGSTLTMNSGKIATTLEDDHLSDAGGYDATALRVDAGSSAVINGGTIENICDFTSAIENYGTVVVNDAKITAIHTAVYNKGTMTFNGGSVSCGMDGTTRHTIYDLGGKIVINGGTFVNTAKDQNATGASVINGNVEVNGGTFEGRIEFYYGTPVIKGGAFNVNPTNWLAEGCTCTQNADGKWVVAISNLQTVINNANAGDTIVLNGDVTATSVIMIDKDIVIEGNGYKVSSTATRVFRVITSDVEVTLNNVNMVSNAVRVSSNDIRGISVDGDLTNISLTLNDCSVDFTDASAHDWAYAVNVAGGTGYTVIVNGGVYEGANVININGAGQTVVVKNATLTSLYQPSPYENMYGACIYVKQNANSSVEAVGNTFNGVNAVAINAGYTPVVKSDNIDNTTRA